MARVTTENHTTTLAKLAEKIRRHQRALVLSWLQTLEPHDFRYDPKVLDRFRLRDQSESEGFWRDAGGGVEQWVQFK